VNGVVTDIGTLAGDQQAIGEGISADGRIVGISYSRGFHAFVWQNAKMMQLPALGGNDFAEGLGVNRSGQVVGQAATPNAGVHAVIWQAPPLSP
jgi:probable HAF family extracellular repeat protein